MQTHKIPTSHFHAQRTQVGIKSKTQFGSAVWSTGCLRPSITASVSLCALAALLQKHCCQLKGLKRQGKMLLALTGDRDAMEVSTCNVAYPRHKGCACLGPERAHRGSLSITLPDGNKSNRNNLLFPAQCLHWLIFNLRSLGSHTGTVKMSLLLHFPCSILLVSWDSQWLMAHGLLS